MRKPGILIVGNFFSTHVLGTVSICEELSLLLSRKGWRVVNTSCKFRRINRLTDKLCSVIFHKKEYEIAIVDVYSGSAFFWAEMVVLLLVFLHKPVVLVLRGGRLLEFAKRNPGRVTNLLRKGDIILTLSAFLQVGLKPYNSSIRYLPGSLDISLYKFQVRRNPAPKLIWLRAFHKIYQPEMAIKVISLLSKEFKESTLTMVGPDRKDGSLRSVLRLAESLGVASRINIVGKVPKSEVPVWLAKGDIFLNTTRYESFGVSVLEAALMGLPIVTTNVGELPFLWENEKTALLVPFNDPESMANAVKRILTDPELAERLSQNARKKVEKYDWSVVLPQWEELLLSICKS